MVGGHSCVWRATDRTTHPHAPPSLRPLSHTGQACIEDAAVRAAASGTTAANVCEAVGRAVGAMDPAGHPVDSGKAPSTVRRAIKWACACLGEVPRRGASARREESRSEPSERDRDGGGLPAAPVPSSPAARCPLAVHPSSHGPCLRVDPRPTRPNRLRYARWFATPLCEGRVRARRRPRYRRRRSGRPLTRAWGWTSLPSRTW